MIRGVAATHRDQPRELLSFPGRRPARAGEHGAGVPGRPSPGAAAGDSVEGPDPDPGGNDESTPA